MENKNISWEYRCGFTSGTNFERVYRSTVNGTAVWKNSSRNKTTYFIGEKEYKTEEELIKAVNSVKWGF